MRVLAIDPGTTESAWVAFDGERVIGHGIQPNEALLTRFELGLFGDVTAVVFEQIESYGMAVGREVFETVFWTGRLYEAASAYEAALGLTVVVSRMPRKAVKLHLCQSVRAQDSNIRFALVDRFGGKDAAIGRKKTPGPLFGIKSHEWSALAIAVTYHDQQAVGSSSAERTSAHV